MLPHTLLLQFPQSEVMTLNKVTLSQGKNPLPLTDNTFISLTVMYVMLQHCMLIAIRGYISFALYPAPKFSQASKKDA